MDTAAKDLDEVVIAATHALIRAGNFDAAGSQGRAIPPALAFALSLVILCTKHLAFAALLLSMYMDS